jgi:hypothetical protein
LQNEQTLLRKQAPPPPVISAEAKQG